MDKQESANLPEKVEEKSSWSFKDSARGVFDSATTLAKDAAASASGYATQAGNAASGIAGKTLQLVGDLNGDGKVDEEDLKIALAKGKEFATMAASEAGTLAKGVLKSDLVKDAAAGAVVGAVLVSPIPFVGSVAGAVFGGAVGAATSLRKK